ncbi:lipopolysaccharide biosynthesis protein, partial [Bacteroides thetaiotaomicron]|nr:lipopolysaccharide biosynthesis protein [Bacteroides thetaiotaomicron]
MKNIPTYGMVFCRLILICTLCDILSGTLGYGALATGKIRNYQMVMSLLFLMNLPVVFLFFKLG